MLGRFAPGIRRADGPGQVTGDAKNMNYTLHIKIVAATMLLTPHVTKAQTNNAATELSTQTQSVLYPGADLYVIKRFTVTTNDGGLQGISPGEKVKFIREEMGDYIITAGTNEGRASKSSFTQDPVAADKVRANTENQARILATKNAEHSANLARIQAEKKDNEKAILLSLPLNVKVRRVKNNLVFGNRDAVGLFHNRPEFDRLESSPNEQDREKAKRLGTFPDDYQEFVVVNYPKVHEIAEGEEIQIVAIRIENYTDEYSTYMQYRFLRYYDMSKDLREGNPLP
jgi:hypothetical protein